jgi:hypothetical protein
MGCGASTPAAVQDNDIESREAQLKARFTPTHLLRDSIDTAALLKVLELAQGSIFKRRNNVAGGDVSTAPGMSAGGAEDDDGLSSRRQQRYMTSSMLLSRRGTGLGSVAGAPPDDSRYGPFVGAKLRLVFVCDSPITAVSYHFVLFFFLFLIAARARAPALQAARAHRLSVAPAPKSPPGLPSSRSLPWRRHPALTLSSRSTASPASP